MINNKLSIDPDEKVACPNCQQSFLLSQALSKQVIDGYRADFDSLIAGERQRLAEQVEASVAKRLELAHQDQVAQLAQEISQAKAETDSVRRLAQASKLKASELAKLEAAAEAEVLKEELAAKNKNLEMLRANEAELRKQKLVLETQTQELGLEVQRQVDEQRKTIEAASQDKYGLQLAELSKQIEDAKKANQLLERKLSQGSQQLQGEVLELELEDLLARKFPLDSIEPVGKGKRGADVIQVVCQANGATCGRIVWETKRAENWVKAWVTKLKDDQNAIGGDIGVLVSTVFPAGLDEPMLQYEGIWLVRPHLVRPLAEALRMALIESYKQKAAAAGKDDNIEALYNYITSPQFAHKVKAVVDAYRQMRSDLDGERAAMQKLWKKRETQIDRITSNVMGLVGEIEGLSTERLPQLEAAAGLLGEDT